MKPTLRRNGKRMATLRTTHHLDRDEAVGALLSIWSGILPDEEQLAAYTKAEVGRLIRAELWLRGADSWTWSADRWDNEDVDDAVEAAEALLLRLFDWA